MVVEDVLCVLKMTLLITKAAVRNHQDRKSADSDKYDEYQRQCQGHPLFACNLDRLGFQHVLWMPVLYLASPEADPCSPLRRGVRPRYNQDE